MYAGDFDEYTADMPNVVLLDKVSSKVYDRYKLVVKLSGGMFTPQKCWYWL